MPYQADGFLVAVVGPTGAGKSELALRIAQEFGGEIVNCDSLQIYRHLDIGTAKLRPEERRGIPHHLMDVAEPHEVFSAGEYARRARQVLREIAARGRLPVVCGGTGFYLRALLEGLFPGPQRDEALRQRLAAREARRPGLLYRLLRRLDPASAARIHPSDRHKLIRAVEVCLLLRRPLSEAFTLGRDRLEGFRVLKIGLDPPREALYQRLNERCRKMFEAGLVDETRRILELGYAPDVKPLGSHGYRQAVQMLRGELTYEQALYYAQRDTRRYAKRQWTWFRREPDIVWFRGFGDDPAVQQEVLERVRQFLQEAVATA
ncbi:MAG TPA: tRNA (adenosine(37)-N6)-dimethylallyltransferase MiaA [Bryobacteraceae bacterium]|nr:tRNA (adenosine(37)-N6)-dimethylallyltransferase MiaA [Bryobacteraceae bacterium]